MPLGGGILGGLGKLTSGFLGSAVQTLAGATPNLAGATFGSGVIGGTLAGSIGGAFLQNELAKQFAQKPQQQAAQVSAQGGQQFFAPPGGSGPPPQQQVFGTGVPSFQPVPQTFGAPGFLGSPPPAPRGAGFFGVPDVGQFRPLPRTPTTSPLAFGGSMPGTPSFGSSFAAPALGALGGILAGAGRSIGGVVARNPVISGTVGGVLAGEALDIFQQGGMGGQFFRATASGARAIPLVMIPNPVTGAPTFFKHAGRPILFSGDLTAAKRVNKLAQRARRKR